MQERRGLFGPIPDGDFLGQGGIQERACSQDQDEDAADLSLRLGHGTEQGPQELSKTAGAGFSERLSIKF